MQCWLDEVRRFVRDINAGRLPPLGKRPLSPQDILLSQEETGAF